MLKMIPVRQKFPPAPPLDIVATLRRDFVPAVKPGARIAVGVGSRGISNLAITVRTVVDLLKARGAQPFIIPAMGSHGGATPQGQTELLGEYEVTEKTMGVPIRAAMEVETLGKTEDGVNVVFSMEALRSDGIVVINRVKPHTDFGAPLGSGVIKMIAIGFGKQVGAATYHAAASRLGMERVIRTVSTIVLPRVPILAGVALIEDSHHATAKVAVIQPAELEAREIELQAEARRMMPKLPFDEMDVLVIDWMGKNITGAGMDPNITGRRVHGYSTALRDHTGKPMIHRLYVRGLTPESHGNAIGIGMADFTTTRLVKTIDASVTAMNALTALSINSAKIPMAFDTDREGIRRILETVPHPDGSPYRVVRIESTLNLGKVEVSEAYAQELAARPDLEPLGPAREMKFDSSDNLLPIGA